MIRSSPRDNCRIGLCFLLPAALALGCAPVAERREPAIQSSDPALAVLAQTTPTPFRAATLADLVRDSPMVFRGRVAEQASERDQRGLIVTRTRFDVEEVLVGPRGTPAVTLTTLGGRIGGEEMTASHAPRFRPGPTYIVFADPTRTTYTPVTGDEHGVFIVDPAAGRVLTARSRVVLSVEGGELRLGPFLPSAGAEPRTSGGAEQAPQVYGSIIGATTATEPARPLRAVTPEAFAAAIRSLGAGR
jgi:hypothetical protein